MVKLTESITLESFGYVRQGLFEKHKIIFSTYVCLRIMEKQGLLKPDEIRQFIQGRILSSVPPIPDQVKSFLTEQIWRDCKALEHIKEL